MHSLNLDFGLIAVNLPKVIKLFKKDLDDDWFLDPLRFNDRLKNDTITQYFEQNIIKNNGVYESIRRIELNVPKKGYVLRYSLETCFFDRIAYHAYVLLIDRTF